jgi:transcriptional regulator with XRE-family HTH domain
MDRKAQLGEFLRSRRAQLRPQDVGVRRFDERRRVAGLRREELALLAGVSVSYYTRLEQGQSSGASPEVLDAIARALRLDESERRHLHDLARADRAAARGRRPPPERVTEATAQLMATFGHVPAMVLGRRSDVLAWNRLGHALYAGHLERDAPDVPGRRPNMARLVFLDGHIRELYADWPSKARAVVGNLRLVVGQYTDDELLHALVGELLAKSPQFADLWADHRLKRGNAATFEMRHPLVGSLTVVQQNLGNGPGQTIVVATAQPGSPSHAALELLAHLIDHDDDQDIVEIDRAHPASRDAND